MSVAKERRTVRVSVRMCERERKGDNECVIQKEEEKMFVAQRKRVFEKRKRVCVSAYLRKSLCRVCKYEKESDLMFEKE